MSAVTLLLELHARGIAVDVAGGHIRCRHRPGALPPELAGRVRARRGEVLALLADPDVLREAAARAIFDAEPDEGKRPEGEVTQEGLRCRACRSERDPEMTVCPVCHPPLGRTIQEVKSVRRTPGEDVT